MKKRLRSLQRIVSIRRQICRSSEWRLARLASEERAALQEQVEIMAALNADQPLHGLFMETFARHLRRLSKRIAELHREMAAELSRLKAESGQLKRAERMLADVRQTQARAAEARELMEIVEAASARDAASLP